MNLHEMFEAVHEEYLDFDKVAPRLSERADLHAFMLLDKLQPGGGDIISAAAHDEFFLSIDCDELAKVITQEQVLELARCGIRYDEGNDCLCMFA